MKQVNEMNRCRIVSAVALTLLLTCVCVGQQNSKPGGVKGKVRVETGASAEGVSVSVQQDEKEVAHAATDSNGRFELNNLAPGRYSIRFRKQGLRTAEIKDYEISAGR